MAFKWMESGESGRVRREDGEETEGRGGAGD